VMRHTGPYSPALANTWPRLMVLVLSMKLFMKSRWLVVRAKATQSQQMRCQH